MVGCNTRLSHKKNLGAAIVVEEIPMVLIWLTPSVRISSCSDWLKVRVFLRVCAF